VRMTPVPPAKLKMGTRCRSLDPHFSRYQDFPTGSVGEGKPRVS
jgi:hypothetical protein